MEVNIKMYLMSVRTCTSIENGARYFEVDYTTQEGELKATKRFFEFNKIEEVIYKTVNIERKKWAEFVDDFKEGETLAFSDCEDFRYFHVSKFMKQSKHKTFQSNDGVYWKFAKRIKFELL